MTANRSLAATVLPLVNFWSIDAISKSVSPAVWFLCMSAVEVSSSYQQEQRVATIYAVEVCFSRHCSVYL
jgi:hypothetical protein